LGNNPGCWDCHGSSADDGRPNGGPGFPNNQNAHNVHVFNGVDCDACHFTAYQNGKTTTLHGNSNRSVKTRAVVSINPDYKAETGGAPAYDTVTKKCSNISCHGGTHMDNLGQSINLTPSWDAPLTGLLSECLNCHQYRDPAVPESLQYNNPYSGKSNSEPKGLHFAHSTYFNTSLNTCTRCHDIGKLTRNTHFGGLPTSAMTPADSAGSILQSIGYNGTGCTTVAAGCHGPAIGPSQPWK
jgi:predicted CxxxxCH...CXXCH cytochrome family protein